MKNIYSKIILLFFPFISIGQTYLVTGSYTSGMANGIYIYQFDNNIGQATLLDSAITSNPSYLAISSDGHFIYSTNQPNENKQGAVSAYSFVNGTIKKINTQPSGGDGPCYVSLDKTGKWLAVANYFAGTFSILPVLPDGSLGKPDTTIIHTGSCVNAKRQEKAHAHCGVFSPDNKFLFVTDLGMDKIMVYAFDENTGMLSTPKFSFTTITPGGGPRHLTFHPNGKLVYLIEELSGNVEVYQYSTKGKLKNLQTISSLPNDFTGAIGAADIHVSSDGKFLYTSNRGDANSITIFSINRKGKLAWAGYQSALGKKPRNFNIDPSGNYLLVANQDSDEIVVFKRNAKSGLLTDTGNRIRIGNPVCIQWIQ